MHKCSEFIFFYNHLLANKWKFCIFVYLFIYLFIYYQNFFCFHSLSLPILTLWLFKKHTFGIEQTIHCVRYSHTFLNFTKWNKKKQPSLSFTTPFFLFFSSFPIFAPTEVKEPLSNPTLYKYNTYNGAFFLNNNTIQYNIIQISLISPVAPFSYSLS